MNTAFVTFGSGKFAPFASALARRLEALNGAPCVLLPVAPDGSDFLHVKARMWDYVPADVDRIVYVDADTYPHKPLGTLPDADFAAVPDAIETQRAAPRWYPPLACLASPYFNAGFFVCTRATAPRFQILAALLRQGWRMACDGWPHWHEQDYLNLLFAVPGYHVLPTGFNYVAGADTPRPDDLRMEHFAGVPDHIRLPVLAQLYEKG